ncbi:hypothetical protein HDU76_013820 [Blyttiomyces sp. JEL0837]|nr:hypothetical protein HDU76_013820 [Blyttiomyces sp. JEL0837]
MSDSVIPLQDLQDWTQELWKKLKSDDASPEMLPALLRALRNVNMVVIDHCMVILGEIARWAEANTKGSGKSSDPDGKLGAHATEGQGRHSKAGRRSVTSASPRSSTVRLSRSGRDEEAHPRNSVRLSRTLSPHDDGGSTGHSSVRVSRTHRDEMSLK